MEIKYDNKFYRVNSMSTFEDANRAYYLDKEADLPDFTTLTDGIWCTTTIMADILNNGVLVLELSGEMVVTANNIYSLRTLSQLLSRIPNTTNVVITNVTSEKNNSATRLVQLLSENSLLCKTTLVTDINEFKLLSTKIIDLGLQSCKLVCNDVSVIYSQLNLIKMLSKSIKLTLSVPSDVTTNKELVDSEILDIILSSVSAVELVEVVLDSPAKMDKYGVSQDIYHLMDFNTNIICPVFSRLIMINLIKHISTTYTNLDIVAHTTNYEVGIKLTNYIIGIVKY